MRACLDSPKVALPVVYETQHDVFGVFTNAERRQLVGILGPVQVRLADLQSSLGLAPR